MKFSKTFKVNEKYLALPVNPVDKSTHDFMSIYVGDELMYDVFLDIDITSPRFFAFCNIEQYRGLEITVSVEGENIDARILDYLEPKDTYPGEDSLYVENGRSQLHYSPARGYVSDPNGLFYYNGCYHMFYQHDPFNLTWGDWKDHVNFGWGHAISYDLIHWKELPDALLPDERGPIFSGSGVVDVNNISGLKEGEHPPIILYYTAAGGQARRSRHLLHEQCIAVSLDGGETFTKYKNNPIVPFKDEGNRDPKVFFHPDLKKWMMITFSDNGNKYLIYTSDDLINFEFVCELKIGTRECPDLLYLDVVEEPGKKTMVFWVASGVYVVVDFDGRSIKTLMEPKKLHSAFVHACAQTFNNAPNGRTIQMAVYRMHKSGLAVNGCMAIPHEIFLHKDKSGDYWLEAVPIENINSLRVQTNQWNNISSDSQKDFNSWPQSDIEISLSLQNTTFDTHGIFWELNANERTLTLNGEVIPLPYSDKLDFRIILDSCTAQIYEPNNRVFVEFGYDVAYNQVKFLSKFYAEKICIHALKSIWDK